MKITTQLKPLPIRFIRLARRVETPIAKRIECQDLVNILHSEAKELFWRIEQIHALANQANSAQAMELETGELISQILHHCHMVTD